MPEAVTADKHLDFGAWFGAMVAGYAADKLLTWLRPRWLSLLATGMCAVALVLPARQGAELSDTTAGRPKEILCAQGLHSSLQTRRGV